MASPAAKSLPLHNFPLPSLWSKSNHRARRHLTASPPPPRREKEEEREGEWHSHRISVPIPQIPIPPKPQIEDPPSDRRLSIKIRLPKEGREREAKAEAEKAWNLRPRRKKKRSKRRNVGPKTEPGNKTTVVGGGEKPPGRFSLSLTRKEIAEDLFAMTGAKPNRRPKKRPRTVQKQLDDIFPGMWLGSITPGSYKVNEAPEKA